jgi:hypothetical protein
MGGDKAKEVLERRSSDRVMDDSILLVSGYNTSGLPFSEITKINDVSPGGISFLLRTPVELDVSLDISICSAKSTEVDLSPIYRVKANVLRISKWMDGDAYFLIAARFKGDFVKLVPDYSCDDVARELEHAIELDERFRDQGGH